MSFKRTVALDFDGVIHDYKYGWQGADVVEGDAVPGAMQFIIDLHTAGFAVAVHSARSGQFGGIAAMKQAIGVWMHDHVRSAGLDLAVMEAVLGEIEYPEVKPAAFLTIDDRAVQFTGVFPSIQSIETFKPWYK